MTEERINIKDVPKDDIREGLELLRKKRERDAKIARGEIKGHSGKAYKDMSPEEKDKRRAYTKKRNQKIKGILARAAAAGIK
jgi:hypothetical protein